MSAYIIVDDVDQHCERARAAGAQIFEEPPPPYVYRRVAAL